MGPGSQGRPAPRAPRSDGRRNRERILAVATEAFAAEGLGVSVQELARRAGVGTGTVSRHFPTKQNLYEAIIVARGEGLVEAATALESEDADAAFRDFFALMVEEGAANQAIAEALSGTGFDLASVGPHSADVLGVLQRLLVAAQKAGRVRGDIDLDDVKALIGACVSRGRGPDGPASRARLTELLMVALGC